MPKPTYLLTLLLLPLLSVADQIINTNVPDYWPNGRYTVNDDGTVTDTNTSLMWMQCSLGQTHSYSENDGNSCTGTALTYTWQTALESVNDYNQDDGFAGHTDWRLPNVKELVSLLAHNRYNPAINIVIFPNTPLATFWSSSPGVTPISSAQKAWRLSFQNGTIMITSSTSTRTYANYVRLVRSTD